MKRSSVKCLVLLVVAVVVAADLVTSNAQPPGGRSSRVGGGVGGPGGGGGPGSDGQFGGGSGQQGGRGRGPGGPGGDFGGGPDSGNEDPAAALKHIMSLDSNGDECLTPNEVTDPRLQNLLQRADTDGNRSVTRDELTAAFAAAAAQQQGRSGGPGGMGPGGDGGPGGMGPGRTRGPMGRPGEVLPQFMQDELQCSDAQREQLAALQAEVDARLSQILSQEQIRQLSSPANALPQVNGGPGQNSGQSRRGRGSSQRPPR